MSFLAGEKNSIIMPSYNFTVYVDGVLRLSFSKISSINYDVETEPLKEGGMNDKVIILRSQKSSARTLVMEQGVITNLILYPTAYDSAGNALALAYGNIMRPGRRLYMPMFIVVNDNGGFPRKYYTINGAFVRSWSISDLDASSSGILIQKFEVDYQDIDISDIGPIPL